MLCTGGSKDSTLLDMYGIIRFITPEILAKLAMFCARLTRSLQEF